MRTLFCSSALFLLLTNTANGQDFTRGLKTKTSKFAKVKSVDSHPATKAFSAKAAKDFMSMEFVWAGKSKERGSKAKKTSLGSEEMSMGGEAPFIHKNIFGIEIEEVAATALSMEFVPLGSKSIKVVGPKNQATKTESADFSMMYVHVSAKSSKNTPYEVDSATETSSAPTASKSTKYLTIKSSKSVPIVISTRSISFSTGTEKEVSEANESDASGADVTSNIKVSAAAIAAAAGAMLIL